MPNWTKEQTEAIYESGKNIIVSAGAGSGKTAVLSERVLQKVLNGVSIDRLLILTFTNLAAREMKRRIRKKIKEDSSLNLKDQLNKLDSSYITTFDSYSLSIVKKYHHLLNISRDVNIIDKNILDMQIANILDEIFMQKYQDHDSNFLKLINDFCIKDDKNIKEEIIKLNDKLNMRYDKEEYLNRYLDLYYNDEMITKRIDEYLALMNQKVLKIKRHLEDLEHYCDSDYVMTCYQALNDLLHAVTYDDYLKVFAIKLPNIKRGSLEGAKTVKEKITDLLKEIKEMACYDSLDDMKEIIISTKPYLVVILDIICLLDNQVNKYKHDNDLYDFVDISKLAIKIVKENKNIREEIKHYFIEILVDEYQDTSDLQEEFINSIANNNVYMVGDIKQSIYRFRNANPNIFKNKYDCYSEQIDGMKIDLLKNFRSREEVLDNINRFFQFILDDYIGGADYRKSHEMVFGNMAYNEEGKTNQNYQMELYNYDYNKDNGFAKNEIEAFIIANDIKQKIRDRYQVFDKDKKIFHDITYGDIVILVDRSTPFELYKKIFLYCQIPLSILTDEYLNKSNDLLVIRNIFKLLKLVKEENYGREFTYSFLSVGRSFLCHYSDDELFEIIKDKKIFASEIYHKIKDILVDIDDLTINDILDRIIDTFAYYDKLLTIGNIKESMVRIDYLYDLGTNLSNLGYSYLEFADYIDHIFSDERDIRFSLDSETSNSVKIMSIHKSKGLEYHLCYFPCLYPKFNESDLKEKFIYDKELGIITPYFKEGIGNTFYKDLFRDNYKREEIGEKIRLFYVALTRAKEKMILVMPNEVMEEEYDGKIVDNDIRLHYNSFLSMIKSIKSKLQDYIVNIDINKIGLTRKYNVVRNSNVFNNIEVINKPITIKERVVLPKKEISRSHYSKSDIKLIDKDLRNKLDFGTYMHYLLEVIDLQGNIDDYALPDMYKDNLKKFLASDLLKDISKAKVYKEYEFIYEDEMDSKHGIIDLMLEYEDHLDIIDYKLKNIDDVKYQEQLKGYQNYIMNKTKKPVNLYLYSIIDAKYEAII